ncbi:hypothetical protein EV426DRAFT_585437 [Tirmania nivea]|nr:hypothetical protein EV426DRAFT_585437 [Tirmania nivea]
MLQPPVASMLAASLRIGRIAALNVVVFSPTLAFVLRIIRLLSRDIHRPPLKVILSVLISCKVQARRSQCRWSS